MDFFESDVEIICEQAYYKLHRQAKSWYDARATCGLEGATLVYPETAAESALLAKLLEDAGLSDANVWVGAHDIFAEGTFVKLNGG
ncbi:Hemolymph lipopolysaccharide-binding protein [Eumeta japonica]|uniref:Hemolymph lipopolysaccharide-binding protein n=1 Tax=Eumeta variegata TaxID=151549 RepID=A0A4C1WXT2_EUMVA|nr:Hemolymph lipopolysaccharide-binding protein [Eumeta japonica]